MERKKAKQNAAKTSEKLRGAGDPAVLRAATALCARRAQSERAWLTEKCTKAGRERTECFTASILVWVERDRVSVKRSLELRARYTCAVYVVPHLF